MRQRRRAERLRQAPTGASQQRTRLQRERRQQRLAYVVAGVAGTLLLAVLLGGFYFAIYRPPRVVVAQVGDVPIQLREVAAGARLFRGLGLAIGPQQVLNLFVRNEVLQQRGVLDYAAVVASEEVDQVLARQFEDLPSEPEAQPPTTLTAEGKERYQDFLKNVDVSDQLYRAYLEGNLMMDKARSYAGAQVQSPQEQVFLHWIVAATQDEAEQLAERLKQGEDFAAVAKELDRPIQFASDVGEVGWVPRGAFPELDEAVFAAEVGSLVGPVSTVFGLVVAKVTQGPEPQPISDQMRDRLSEREVDNWLRNQLAALLTAYEFGDKEMEWVARRLAESRPPPGSTQGG